MIRTRTLLLIPVAVTVFFTACSTSRTTLNPDGFLPSDANVDSLITLFPNYGKQLETVKGKGRAIVSEPGNSERVTIDFQANREKSLLTVRNRIGIEGGQLLVDADSILIINRIDNVAQKIPVKSGRMTSLNELASVNIIELLLFKIAPADVDQIFENDGYYLLVLKNKVNVIVGKKKLDILKVEQPPNTSSYYSEITYDGYGALHGFKLPRQITILSADKKSKVAFLVRTLEINTEIMSLQPDIADDMKIERL